MKTTTIITTTVGVILAALVLATVLKLHAAPAVKNSYFDPDTDKLKLLPAGIVLFRPTHFPNMTGKVRHIHNEDSASRTLGRDVTLRQALAEAYDCNPARVVLPANAPAGGYDFLITTAEGTRDHLRTAIRQQLGYVAHSETRDTDVMVLKVADPSLPGLTVSPDSEPEDATMADGKLHVTHQPLSTMVAGLASGLKLPIVDQTGLTNCYDYSVIWNDRITEKMRDGGFDLDGVKKVLGSWGLKLDSDTTSMDMLVVEKAH